MATLKLIIVTPEKLAYQGEVNCVVIPASEGEIGVLPMHLPLVTQIKPGELVISKGERKEYLAVGDGFVTVTQDTVNVLTDMAIEWEDIDEGAAEAAVKRAQEALAEHHDLGSEETAAIQASLAKRALLNFASSGARTANRPKGHGFPENRRLGMSDCISHERFGYLIAESTSKKPLPGSHLAGMFGSTRICRDFFCLMSSALR
jgi:F-type H+-transporting ATPase subunit epsilon